MWLRPRRGGGAGTLGVGLAQAEEDGDLYGAVAVVVGVYGRAGEVGVGLADEAGGPRGFRTGEPLLSPVWTGDVLPQRRKKYSREYRDEAARMVVETSRPIAQVARELGIVEGTLGNWVNLYRQEHADDEPSLDVSERARLRQLEREMREVRMENEFLKKAAAYFAQTPQ